MVEESDVEQAYKLILGRAPESREVVIEHARSKRTIAELRRQFINSREFREQLGMPPLPDVVGYKPLNWPKGEVEVEVTEPVLLKMLERIEKEFTYMGGTEPYWSVISRDEFLSKNIAENRQDFLASGQGVVNDLVSAAARYQLSLDRYQVCLELGCGVGRSTIWLASRFNKVIGADISLPHLRLAEQILPEMGKQNVELLHVNGLRTLEQLPQFDVFFSILVLQHNPPPIIHNLLRIVFNKLRPGGLAYFQVPTYIFGYNFAVQKYLATDQPPGRPEMHVLPQPVLFDLIVESGCRLVELREDGAAGPSSISNRALVQKHS